jgi:hypothetical protein
MIGENEKLWVAGLTSSSQDEREDAAYAIAKSCSAELMEPLWQALEKGIGQPGVFQGAAQGLIDGAPRSIEILVRQLETQQAKVIVQICAYALGEIAYLQEADRDERIPRALIAALQELPAPNSWSAAPFTGALRECARAGPVEAATPPLKSLLDSIAGEEDPFLFSLDNVMETLFINEDGAFLDEIATRLRRSIGSPAFSQRLMQFLASHQARQT